MGPYHYLYDVINLQFQSIELMILFDINFLYNTKYSLINLEFIPVKKGTICRMFNEWNMKK